MNCKLKHIPGIKGSGCCIKFDVVLYHKSASVGYCKKVYRKGK